MLSQNTSNCTTEQFLTLSPLSFWSRMFCLWSWICQLLQMGVSFKNRKKEWQTVKILMRWLIWICTVCNNICIGLQGWKRYDDVALILFLAINIKWLKCAIKAKELACRYHMISAHLLGIAHLLRCLLILPLHYAAFDDIVMQWRRAKPCHAHWQNSYFNY